MKRLYAPWRSDYSSKVTGAKEESVDQKDCIFCTQFKTTNDAQYFILGRYHSTIAMLNLYPYNAGHILLLPYKHTANLEELSSEERCELMELIQTTQHILKTVLHAEGINIGFNLGKAAGAGIPSHLHIHVIPRWFGDTNFLPLIADTKQISTNLHEIYQKLLPFFHTISMKK